MNPWTRARRRWVISGILIAASLAGLAVIQLKSNLVYFYTPDEVYLQFPDLQNKTIKVGGMVLPGSIRKDDKELVVQFVLSDLKEHNISVLYRGVLPDMFKEGQGVVAEGIVGLDGKSMVATKLMVKHSEEYKKPGNHESIDKELLQKSIFKS